MPVALVCSTTATLVHPLNPETRMTTPRMMCLGAVLIAAGALLLSCAMHSSPAAISERPGTFSPVEVSPAVTPSEVLVTTEPWTYESNAGKLLATRSYRIFTTSTRQSLTERLPRFMETALTHYRTALTPLPEPAETLESYVMGTRPQWERLTQRMMGADADVYLQIQRGGFSARGRAILFDIGPRDTFAIAAHEGWHQYTQSTFREALPTSFEEGLAAYMEGFRWRGQDRSQPTFMPWANFERFIQLREARSANALMPLERVVRETPQGLMHEGQEQVLTYYAQVWALIHFLAEGDGGVHRPALNRMIDDAAAGRLTERVRDALGSRAAATLRMRRRGVDLLQVYTGKSAEELDAPYRAFIDSATQVGSMQKVSQGLSPVSPAPQETRQ
jgi:hypothetical protein